MRKIPCTILFSFLLFLATAAQQALLSASGNAENSTGSSSYSVGQLAYITLTDATGFIIEGVQQPYEIQFLPGIEENNGKLFAGSVYPNPTSGEVTLKIEGWSPYGLLYRITDIRGNLLVEQPVETCQQVVPMESLPPRHLFSFRD